eukprot:scaffold30933_cov101-Isochrysis_galbana.AAC.4
MHHERGGEDISGGHRSPAAWRVGTAIGGGKGMQGNSGMAGVNDTESLLSFGGGDGVNIGCEWRVARVRTSAAR